VLASWGCEVSSIDLPDRPSRSWPALHAVEDYDGAHIPFGDRTFDTVFTSHVLPFLRTAAGASGPTAAAALLAEVARVLRPGGRAIHVLPTRAWRVWTALAAPLAPVAIVVDRHGARSRPPAGGGPSADPPRRSAREQLALAVRAATPRAVAPGATLRSELASWSRARWTKTLELHGFAVDLAVGSQIFYTGHGLLPAVGPGPRHALARLLGSSSLLVVSTLRERT
jgi:SAM-dependent methyltransferase